MKDINLTAAKSNLDFKIHILYFWILFGSFLILWRVYFFYVGHPVPLWFTIFWLGMAVWFIGYGTLSIPFYIKLHKSILGSKYKINDDRLDILMLNNEIYKIDLKDMMVIHLNKNPNMLATAIFFINNENLYQIWVDKKAGIDIAYHCLKWYVERGEKPRCVIVRDVGEAYKVLRQLVPKRFDPVAEIKPAKKIDEKRFLRYIKDKYWTDERAIEEELRRLKREIGENLKIEGGDV